MHRTGLCTLLTVAVALFGGPPFASAQAPKSEKSATKGAGKAGKGKQSAAPPIESRTWNSRGLGALVEGPCTGVDGDQIKIVVDNVERLVPYELFHQEDLGKIQSHFSLKDPFPDQPKTDPVPKSECRMLHTIRGGVLPEAKVVGHQGNTIFLVDPNGLKYRVPFSLFADGVRDFVREGITRIDGKPFQPSDDAAAKVANSKPATVVPKSTPPKPPAIANKPPAEQATPTYPKPGQVVTPTLPTPAPAQTPAAVPPAVAVPTKPAPKPIGDERVWTMRGGKITWQGRFLELAPPLLRILTPEGKNQQLPFEMLEDADRQYAEAIAKNGKPGKAPSGALIVENRDAEFVLSADGKPLYLRDGRKLVPLDNQGQSKGKTITLADDFRLIRQQGDHWLAATDKDVHVLDRQTFRSKKKFELWKYRRINDLAPHPTRALCVVSVEHVGDQVRKNPAENQRIVVLDQATGKVHEPAEAFGAWLRMHPSGKFLLAGFHAAFKSGPSEEIDITGRLVPRLNVEHIDVLNRLRIDGFELPLDQQFENAGANGQGVVLSPEGGRVAYLSFTGYPTYSYQVTALDAADFDQKPVTFAMKDLCDCKRMVYSPKGDRAASPTTGGAVIFDAATGKQIEGALAADEDLLDAAIHDLAFSADGKSLIFIASRAGSKRYVKTVPLNAN